MLSACDHYADQIKELYDNKDGIRDRLVKESIEFRQELSWTKINKQWEELIDSLIVSHLR